MVLADGVAVWEVGAPAGPYQEGVGGEDAVWQHHGDEVLGVPRSVNELYREVADRQPVAILDPYVHAARRGVLVHDDLGRRLCLELPGARDVVGVRVGIHYVGRLEAVLEDEIEHGLDHLEFGVEDRGPTGAGDHVAEAPAFDAELFEEIVVVSLFHGRSSFPAPVSSHPLVHLDGVSDDAVVEVS